MQYYIRLDIILVSWYTGTGNGHNITTHILDAALGKRERYVESNSNEKVRRDDKPKCYGQVPLLHGIDTQKNKYQALKTSPAQMAKYLEK